MLIWLHKVCSIVSRVSVQVGTINCVSRRAVLLVRCELASLVGSMMCRSDWGAGNDGCVSVSWCVCVLLYWCRGTNGLLGGCTQVMILWWDIVVVCKEVPSRCLELRALYFSGKSSFTKYTSRYQNTTHKLSVVTLLSNTWCDTTRRSFPQQDWRYINTQC